MANETLYRQLLKEKDFSPAIATPESEEMWADPAGHIMTFDQACEMAFGICGCCGEYNAYPSAACNARHEAGDCIGPNCSKKIGITDSDNEASSNAS